VKHLISVIAISCAAVTIASSAPARAEQPTPEEREYKFRTSLFQTFAWKLGRMAVAKGQDDEATFIKHAKDLSYLSGLIEEGFQIEGSIPDGSKAKPEIWEDFAKFQDKAANLTKRANGYAAAGAMADFSPRDFGSKACGACHRDFKVKD